MAEAFKLEWNGEELKAQIAAVAEENVMKSARRVMAGAKRRVPVDNGYLKESIKIKKWENKGVVGVYVYAGNDSEEDSGSSHVARFVELGTPGDIYTGGEYKGQKRTPIEAKPYLRPALRAEKKKFIKSFEGAL